MRLLIIFFILSIGLVDTAHAQVFSGQVYVMTEHFTEDGCQSKLECDCCSSDIIFLTDKTFVMVDRCIHNDSYYKGTYTSTNEYLTLKLEQFVVQETYNDATKETKIEKKNLTMAPVRFYITTCNTDNLILQRTDLKVLTKAFKESSEKSDSKIRTLKESKVWGQTQ